MAIEVLGPGFGRTGTKSLQKALEILGVGRCHHMFEVFRRPRQAHRFLRAAGDEETDWDDVFDGYQAAVDWPSTFFWRELTAQYPKARVILTIRDEHSWYESVSRTILRSFVGPLQNPRPEVHMQTIMARRIIFDLTFSGRLEDRRFAISRFRLHNEQVQSEIDSSRLLVYNVAQGWEPLCRFLECPIPAVDFPQINTRGDFPLFLDPLGKRRRPRLVSRAAAGTA